MIVLFDFDGVLVDTETQYSRFWDGIGREFLGVEDFGWTIKGQTLKDTFTRFFPSEADRSRILPLLDDYERNMSYEFLPGAVEFLKSLKSAGIRTAIVTSSNEKKMANVHRAHPELAGQVDHILMSEHFRNSKPDPECFLKGMALFDAEPSETVVFEDSLHGISAGRTAGAKVIGLATTFPAERIAPLCDKVIKDFTSITLSDLRNL